MATKGETASALFLLFTIVAIIIVAWYDTFTTPGAKLTSLFMWFFLLFYVFFTSFGEFLGHVLKRKNFHTEGGLGGVYLSKEEHDGGMVTYYFACQTRYLRYCNFDDYAERGFWQRFKIMWSNVRVASITDKAHMFEDLPEGALDVPEGCIKYRGTLKKGVNILSPVQAMTVKMRRMSDVITEMFTIVEKAKSDSEASIQEQTKGFEDTSLVLSNALSNLDRVKQQNTDITKEGAPR